MEIKYHSPLLPLRDIVVFPSMVIPLFVGRDKSITALNEVMKKEKKIILVTQKNSEVDDPKENDVFTYGCESNILQLLKLPDGTVKVLVEGIKRVKIIFSIVIFLILIRAFTSQFYGAFRTQVRVSFLTLGAVIHD